MPGIDGLLDKSSSCKKIRNKYGVAGLLKTDAIAVDV
jgi:hypothetical protein